MHSSSFHIPRWQCGQMFQQRHSRHEGRPKRRWLNNMAGKSCRDRDKSVQYKHRMYKLQISSYLHGTMPGIKEDIEGK